MYVLYLDDAGSVTNPKERHFVLAGIAIYEQQIHWLGQELERVAATTKHHTPDKLELHGNQILAGRNWWRSVEKDERRRVIRDSLSAAQSLRGKETWCLFGVVVDKTQIGIEDPVEYAFEQIVMRFDKFLMRRYRDNKKDKGLLVLDKSTRETRLQSLAIEFKNSGHRWGLPRNIVDVPFFVDSQATRLIQYADLVSYALWRKFEQGDNNFFEIISNSFDSEGGVIHGLHHLKDKSTLCDCPACVRRLL
jgi:hypothetical protein